MLPGLPGITKRSGEKWSTILLRTYALCNKETGNEVHLTASPCPRVKTHWGHVKYIQCLQVPWTHWKGKEMLETCASTLKCTANLITCISFVLFHTCKHLPCTHTHTTFIHLYCMATLPLLNTSSSSQYAAMLLSHFYSYTVRNTHTLILSCVRCS